MLALRTPPNLMKRIAGDQIYESGMQSFVIRLRVPCWRGRATLQTGWRERDCCFDHSESLVRLLGTEGGFVEPEPQSRFLIFSHSGSDNRNRYVTGHQDW